MLEKKIFMIFMLTFILILTMAVPCIIRHAHTVTLILIGLECALIGFIAEEL